METDTLSALLYANPYEFPTLYAGNPGEPLVQVLNEPVTQWENSLYYIYTITCDGELMQLNPDGTVCNSLYKAKHGQLRDMDYQSGMVFLLDGDFLVQLDLSGPFWKPRTSLTSGITRKTRSTSASPGDCTRSSTS